MFEFRACSIDIGYNLSPTRVLLLYPAASQHMVIIVITIGGLCEREEGGDSFNVFVFRVIH